MAYSPEKVAEIQAACDEMLTKMDNHVLGASEKWKNFNDELKKSFKDFVEMFVELNKNLDKIDTNVVAIVQNLNKVEKTTKEIAEAVVGGNQEVKKTSLKLRPFFNTRRLKRMSKLDKPY